MSESALDTVARQLSRPVRELTPARVFEGQIDGSYHTSTLLSLRAAQAVARRAVTAPLDLDLPAFAPLLEQFGLYEVATDAQSVHAHVANPTLGRKLSEAAKQAITATSGAPGADPAQALSGPAQGTLLAQPPAGPTPADHLARVLDRPTPTILFAVGDGLSAAAVHTQVPALLPRLIAGASERGWQVSTPVAVRHCRVGALGDIGEASRVDVVVLLIGERPGLATAESLSAYLQYRPRPGTTDADRNVISNIHAGGLSTDLATARILQLTDAILAAATSGVSLAT